jgi:hypothetical protein
MEDVKREVVGLAAQAVVFMIGLVVSLGAGMLLGARTEGPGALLVATALAGGGLLVGAVFSQVAHDRIVYRESAAP